MQALHTLLGKVEFVAQKAGELIEDAAINRDFLIESKSFNNLVTEVDKKTEERLVSQLGKLLPEAGFIAEEESVAKQSADYQWIIDPIDGTTNFVHGLPLYCISIALAFKSEIILGVIYNPINKELFSAYKGGGAYLNNRPIQVSKAEKMEHSLFATGFPYDDFEREKQYMEILNKLMHNSRGLRRLGSAAIDLAYVACGRFDAFYEYGLNPWDVAAGIIIVKEAGGKISDFKGGNDFLFGEEIIASNGTIHNELQSFIHSGFKSK
ncbi:inositol monophosphatase [Luteibaculum oceani]|uniref:Inositol-1-monophosphatase n=1 Tax=Luteibaculum oceani TaxID=1294296 RepID=A0A5C6VFM3_9FLAO|nr:inositol monophosphatase [Luteibaculum oceani]